MARDVSSDNPLSPQEQLDSDEVRNDNGDQVVDAPQQWIDPEDDETLGRRLAAEVPDVQPDGIDPDDANAEDIDPDDANAEDGPIQLTSNDTIDRLDPTVHGRTHGQIDGTPEDGESFFGINE